MLEPETDVCSDNGDGDGDVHGRNYVTSECIPVTA